MQAVLQFFLAAERDSAPTMLIIATAYAFIGMYRRHRHDERPANDDPSSG